MVSGDGPFVFALRAPAGSALPAGLSVNPSTGALTWTPTREQAGSHPLELTASVPGGSDVQAFDLQVDCGSVQYQAACSCGAGRPLGLDAVALVLLMGVGLARPRARKILADRLQET